MVIASTGQSAAASLHDATAAAGTCATRTFATSSPISNTCGQVSTQSPQPVHVFLSTIAFMFFSLFCSTSALWSRQKGSVLPFCQYRKRKIYGNPDRSSAFNSGSIARYCNRTEVSSQELLMLLRSPCLDLDAGFAKVELLGWLILLPDGRLKKTKRKAGTHG
jgi:hypothetical protein